MRLARVVYEEETEAGGGGEDSGCFVYGLSPSLHPLPDAASHTRLPSGTSVCSSPTPTVALMRKLPRWGKGRRAQGPRW